MQRSIFLRETGRDAEALQAAQEGVTVAKETGYAVGEMYGLDALACLAGKAGQHGEARRQFLESLLLANKLRDRKHQGDVLRHYAEFCGSSLPPEQAYVLLSAAARIYTVLRLNDLAKAEKLREEVCHRLDLAAQAAAKERAANVSLDALETLF